MKTIEIIEKLWSWIFIIKPFGVNIFAILSVNVSMQLLKLTKPKDHIKDELHLYLFMIAMNLFFSFLYGFIFILPEFNLILFIQTGFLSLVLSSILYEAVKSIKPLSIIKEIISNKLKK